MTMSSDAFILWSLEKSKTYLHSHEPQGPKMDDDEEAPPRKSRDTSNHRAYGLQT